MSSSRFTVSVAGRAYSVLVIRRVGSALTFAIEGTEYSVDVASASTTSGQTPMRGRQEQRAARESTSNEVKAPMPGIISELKVAEGTTVSTGDTLLVIEAMKMENPIKSPRSGTIKQLHVKKGQEVPAGAALVAFE
jgi:biotin carboxyl carrier protein